MKMLTNLNWLLSSIVAGLILLFSQSCNNPSIESSSELRPANLRVGNNDETINYIKGLKEFQKIVKLQDGHIKLLKSKELKFKKIGKQDEDKFKEKLGNAKNNEDIKSAFSVITDNPDAIVEHLDKTYVGMFYLQREVMKLGLDENEASQYIASALKSNFSNKSSDKGAKIDCMGACSGGLNIALDQANLSYEIGMGACVASAFIGYSALIFTGPSAPVAAGLVGAAEILCIGGTYLNYVGSFNLAIQGFDNCTLACA